MVNASITVDSIGNFENGSFGVFGLPIGGAELWRVHCPELREIVNAAHPALADYSRFTFATKSAAELFAAAQVEVEAARDLARKERLAAETQLAEVHTQSNRQSLIERAKTAGEKVFPGRVAATIAKNGAVIVGVWDAPSIPGFGRPESVYGLTSSGDLTEISDSYRYSF